MAAIYDGLTRNIWTGTWSPDGDHPIVLSNELRGGIQYVTGNVGDQLTDIPGQRLQEGMLVYVKNAYDSILNDTFYKYILLPGETRDISTGAVPNNQANWSLATLATERLVDIGDVSDVPPTQDQIITWDAGTGEWVFRNSFSGDVLSSTGFILLDSQNETFHGDLYGNVYGDDSVPIVDSFNGIINGSLYGSVYADDSTILVNAETGTISWHVLTDVPEFVEKTSDTGSAKMPAGTEAEKDAAPEVGYARFNTTTRVFEGYNGIEWIPFGVGNMERVFNFINTGVYMLDMFDGNAAQSASYKLQCKSAEGVQLSTFMALYGGAPETTFSTEYGQILSHNTVIATYEISADAAGIVTVTCEILYPNTKVVFKRDTLSS